MRAWAHRFIYEEKSRRDSRGDLYMVDVMQMAQYAIAFVVLVLVLAVGAQIMAQSEANIQSTAGNNSIAHNIAKAGTLGLKTFGDSTQLIATVLVAVVLIGLLFGGFYFILNRGG